VKGDKGVRFLWVPRLRRRVWPVGGGDEMRSWDHHTFVAFRRGDNPNRRNFWEKGAVKREKNQLKIGQLTFRFGQNLLLNIILIFYLK
jgi:hypothetical protein